MAADGLRDKEAAGQIDVEDAPPLIFFDFQERSLQCDAGVIDKSVYWRNFFHCRYSRFHFVAFGYVSQVSVDLKAILFELGPSFIKQSAVVIEDGKTRAFQAELPGDFKTEASTAAGHKRVLVVEPSAHLRILR